MNKGNFKTRWHTCPNPKCKYEWLAKTDNPPKCPQCQTKLTKEEKETEKR